MAMARFLARSSEWLSEENTPGIELSDPSTFILLSEVIICSVNYYVCCQERPLCSCTVDIGDNDKIL